MVKLPRIDIRLKVSEIRFLRNPLSLTGVKPYLWNIFFKIDGSTVSITPEFRLRGKADFHFSPGSHGNLTKKPLYGGEKIKVPEEVGTWETTLQPLILPHFEAPITAVAGILCVLMEENNLSDKGAEAAHTALNHYIREAFNLALSEFDPAKIDIYNIEQSIRSYFTKRISNYTNGIEGKIGRAALNAQNLLENLWALMDKDEMIGYELWTFTQIDFLEEENLLFYQRWHTRSQGDWELHGSAELVKVHQQLQKRTSG